MTWLFLHGFTGNGSSWHEVRKHLPRSWSIQCPDLPGHEGRGAVPAALPADFEATVDQLAARHLRGDAAQLVGYSLGGRLALGLAMRFPERVAGLSLIGARAGLSCEERPTRVAKDRRLAKELLTDFGAFVDRWQDLPLFESQKSLPRGVLESQRRRRLGHEPRGLAWALDTLSPGLMPDFRGALGQLSMPVRLVVGALDKPYREIAADMARALPKAAIHTIAGAGHNVPMEAPADLAAVLASTSDPRTERR